VDLQRYRRQIVLPGFGEAAQDRLSSATVTVLGCGAIGAAGASVLARAGVGTLRLVDRDWVDRSNLQRQCLFDEDDVAADLPKAEAARRKLARANPEVRIEAVVVDVDRASVRSLVDGTDLVLDGADNFELRLLANEACVAAGVPWVHGAVLGTYGIQWTMLPGETACYACLVETVPPPGAVPTCETAGVLASTVLAVSALQTAEALKILTGNRDRVRRTLAAFDLWDGHRTEVAVGRAGNCAVCGQRRFDRLEGKGAGSATTLCGRNAVQIPAPTGVSLDLDVVAARLSGTGRVRHNRFLLRLEVEDLEITLFPDGRIVVGGTAEPGRARAMVARYLGM
jgi:adenylyltransferase/sulfurtransferase